MTDYNKQVRYIQDSTCKDPRSDVVVVAPSAAMPNGSRLSMFAFFDLLSVSFGLVIFYNILVTASLLGIHNESVTF